MHVTFDAPSLKNDFFNQESFYNKLLLQPIYVYSLSGVNNVIYCSICVWVNLTVNQSHKLKCSTFKRPHVRKIT